MARKRKPPRLYLDKARREWAILDYGRFVRTGVREERREAAEMALRNYLLEGNTNTPSGIVYFVTAAFPNYPIKIGFTQEIGARRLEGLQNAHPYTLYFLGHHPGTVTGERTLHKQFDRFRMRGEWFERTPEILDYIQDNCSNFMATT